MKKSFLLVLIFLSLCSISNGQKFARVLKSTLAQTNDSYSQFVWVTYPTTNNGILSMGRSSRSQFDPLKDRICPTFTCLGLPETAADTPVGLKVNEWVTLDEGDASSLQDDEVKKAVIGAALPSIMQTIGIRLNANRQRAIKMDFSFGGLIMREILPAEIRGYLVSIQSNPNATLTQRSIARQFQANRLSLVTKDIVIDKMRMTIEVASVNDFGMEAALEEKVGSVLGKDSTLKVQIGKQGDRKYVIETTRPLIIARFYQNARDLPE